MSRISDPHHNLNEFGEGKCSVPMWCGGYPAGFCDKPAYGERPLGRTITHWDGYRFRPDGLYAGHVPGLACSDHGGPKVRTYMDGSAWCAVRSDFINLQESPAGFGATRQDAITALEKAP